MKWVLRLIFLVLLIPAVQAQPGPFFISGSVHYGFIIPHASAIRPVADANPRGLQAELSKLNVSDRSWKKCHCYGRDGVGLFFFNFDDPDRLGYTLGGIYFAEAYLKPFGDLKWSVRGTIGSNYVSKTFDAERNPDNKFFSTRFNFFLGIGTLIYYHISEKMAVHGGFMYNHISNAGGKQPNKGMNFPTVAIGWDRTINYEALQPKPVDLRGFDRRLEWMLGGFGSLRSADEGSEPSRYPLVGLFSNVAYPLTGINGINGGIEISHDDSYRERLDRLGKIGSGTVVSVLAGHQFRFGGIYLLQQFGAYLVRPRSVQRRDFFQRYSGFYRLGRWGIGASLIAYGNVADHMDGRVVYFLR